MPKHRRARAPWIAAGVVAAAATLTGVGISVAHDVAALASGCTHVRNDFNGDGYADVAVAEPDRNVGGATQAGAVRVLLGSASGVTTSHNEYFDESFIVGLTPAAFDNFGASVGSGYFNNDCFADLAIGVPGANGDAGRVVVVYGSGVTPALPVGGLDVSRSTTLEASSADSGDASGDRFGMSLASGTFNGSTNVGLAVGAPGDNNGAGAVALVNSTTDGLDGGSSWVTQDSPNIPGASEQGDGFGWSLTAGDVNGDGYADLAVGVPFEDIGTITDAGSVTLLVGPISAGTPASTQGWTEDSTSVVGAAETDDEWGLSLAAGDVNHDGRADLIVGAPGETDGSIKHAGAITVLRGALGGLTGTSSQYFSENSSGIPGTGETNDWFGSALAVGDFNGDGYADVAVGDPAEALGSLGLAGSLTIVNGSKNGLTGTGSTSWTQDTTGIAGSAETNDLFSSSVTALSINGDGYSDLVVGVPGEATSTFTANGAIAVIKGSMTGLTATGNQFIDATGLANGAQSGSTRVGFGVALS